METISTLDELAQNTNKIVLSNLIQSKGIVNKLTATPEDIEYVLKQYESRNLANMDNVTFETISNIGRKEFTDLNNALKEFTSKVSNVKSPGLFQLIDTLQKNVSDADLEGIWNKTVNTKPTVWAKIKSVVSPHAINESLSNQYTKIYEMISERGKGLELKIGECEKQLLSQKREQENNLRDLSKSYDMYYKSFNELKKEYLFIAYIEANYENSLAAFKNTVDSSTQELSIKKQLADYESSLKDIVNKRLLMESSIIKLPLTVIQNKQLEESCKNILKEIDSVTLSSFPTIRQNLASLAIALNAQQGLMSADSIKRLELNSSKLALQTTEKLAIESERMASQNRLKEAEQIRDFYLNFKAMQENVSRTREESTKTIAQVEKILSDTAEQLKATL